MARALVFPGQGSQAVGMGKDLYDAFSSAREVFQEVDDALGQNLSNLMFEGPEDDLTLTENAQPALMTVSLAAMAVLKSEGGFDLSTSADFVAGHSLGEYSALAAAGTFSLADTARLLKLRGQSMQQAVPVGEGAMAALLGLDLDATKEVVETAAEGEVLATANDNAPGQVVVSGKTSAVERAVEVAKENGAKRAMLLQVSAPFHCPMMAPAADVMAKALSEVEVSAPVVPLIANVTAAPVSDPAEIQRLLVEQVTGMVRWRESVETMKSKGVETLVEVGSGKVLSGLTRRIDRELTSANVGSPADVEAFLASL
jgi:[acyl-carrier-protein] S-malonyltransferase